MTLSSATRLLCVIVVSTVLLGSYLFYRHQEENNRESPESDVALLPKRNSLMFVTTPRLNSERGLPTILIATLWFGLHRYPLTSVLLSCPPARDSISKLECNVTSDKNLFYNSDAVVFHAYSSDEDVHSSIENLASLQRPINQRWVMFTVEPPLKVPKQNLRYLDSYGPLINWTATYMKDSDVPSAYYGMAPGVYHGGFDPSRDYLAGRSGMATILISNCKIPRRMEWIKKIQQYIDVQVYGGCGAECSRSDRNGCTSKLKKYKFYLSFENSYCRDYISEKIISNAFENDIVPVVIADVSFTDTSVIPPRSAINALDFPSVKELTDYMRKVGSNSTLYNEYFKWHSHFTAVKSSGVSRQFLCNLCRDIATSSSKITYYTSVHDWYSQEKLCKAYPVPV